MDDKEHVEIESFFEAQIMETEPEYMAPVRPSGVAEEAPPSRVTREKVVISLGGSLLYSSDEECPKVDMDYLREVAGRLRDLSNRYQIFVVAGGGRLAKELVSIARSLGADEASLDQIGILASRLNARLLKIALDQKDPVIPESLDEAVLQPHDRIVVMGGTHPGHTTDAVAAMLAEVVGAARLIIATDVNGVYSEDPKENPEAVRFERLNARDLVLITFNPDASAGSSGVIDPLASRIIARSGITTCILNGRDLDGLVNSVMGGEFDGTRVEAESESALGVEMEERMKDRVREMAERAKKEAERRERRLLLRRLRKKEEETGEEE